MLDQTSRPPRLLPERALPAYAYVPRRWPRPGSDSAEQWKSVTAAASPGPLPETARESTFRWACDLFNQGYYWEAHEVWEELWWRAGRRGPEAELLKALIQFAAAGVKAREGQAHGVRRHALRAAELFRHADLGLAAGARFGLDLPALAAAAEAIATSAEGYCDDRQTPVHRVWAVTLLTAAGAPP